MAVTDVYPDISKLNLWLRNRSQEDLTMADIPELIPLRWPYFRDNWEFIQSGIVEKLSTFDNPSILQNQLRSFDTFIGIQRTAKTNINPFDNADVFYKNYFIFDSVPINSTPISNEEQTIIDNAITKIDQMSKNDFLKIRANVVKARDQLADQVGGTDAAYNSTFNRSPIPASLDINIQFVSELQILQNVVKTVDFILANIFTLDIAFVDPFALAKQNANNTDFDITTYASGNLVKFNYGESLEDVANRYLGSPDKWIDIAIANGLKPPYIDEVGQKLSLLANGSGDEINLAATDTFGNLNKDKFYINQIVTLQSDVQNFPEQRVIINIKEVPVSGEIVLELDGDANLDRYKTAENANLRVFKANTINSSFYILIPSISPVSDPPTGETPWFLRTSGEDEKRAKIDFQLDNNGNISFGSTGDIQLSFGLANAIQAVKLKMAVEQGSLMRHPEFGLVAVQGSKNLKIDDTRALIVQSINSNVERDPRFERVERLDVDYFGSGTSATGFLVTLVVRLAGSSQNIPITFTINVR